ncbi:MAG: 5-methyltetrahydropteroyltriglutamate--homocysteine methyltransferase [Methanolobus sp.]|jgi:5-methyltetrahydropteroyltriglutamate--homocysteine methyltransferase|uniref:methionine synthase n=1 Tax=Methanolobus sp. TaxID=1874737 RepID=UPI00258E3FFB|nr:methionine synthase [Methanolobus sp.]MDK2832184.1 5-methyltetrahydropteroyltriglutamate--homocysteine methyltransferase [Methanolobus sp.]MDK2938384.1 5-methyltetrahydropteroyltriglutamate--homocysteine methyltransferase [Methanolobus sp.]
MAEIIFDDIGSFPLPAGTSKEWMAGKFSEKKSDADLFKVIIDAFMMKVEAGVEVATYPQYQDMNEQFLSIIRDPDCTEEPFKVKVSDARIIELEAISEVAKTYREENGERLNVRVCVTGPLELYLKEFGGTEYVDILNLLGESVDRFVQNSLSVATDFNIKTISIDEPSIGINPQVMFSDNDLIKAMDTACSSAKKAGCDVEIHLHSPLHYKLACQTENISVIGVESAATPSYLDLIDKKELEDSDSYMRVGIARTDVFNLVSVLNDKYNTNVWKETQYFPEIINDMETPEIISKRLSKAYSMFGESIKYAGPDCGLGAWPSQEIAAQLLSNVSKGMSDFRKSSE